MSKPLLPNPKRKSEAADFHRRVFAKHGYKCYFCGGHATDAMHIYGRGSRLGSRRYAAPEENGRPGCRACHNRIGWCTLSFTLKDRKEAVTALNAVLKTKLEMPT